MRYRDAQPRHHGMPRRACASRMDHVLYVGLYGQQVIAASTLIAPSSSRVFAVIVRPSSGTVEYGGHGAANITASISSDYECSRRINRAFDADRLPRPSRSRPTSDGA